MNQAMQDIQHLLQDYFDGLYTGDTELFARVFHPEASYVSAVPHEQFTLNMSEYFERVRHRASPQSQQQPRYDRILSIEILDTHIAVAKVQCALPPKLFIDCLTLLHTPDGWRIISKVFNYTLID